MKKLLLLLASTFLLQFSNAQNKTDLFGVWQAKLNGKLMTGKDLGVTQSPYSNHFIFYVFSKDASYIVIGPNKTQITKAGMPGLIKNQSAGEGTYKIYDSVPAIEDETVRKKFEGQSPFKAKTIFVQAYIQGNPTSFYYEPDVKKMFGLNKEAKLELLKVGIF